MTFDKGLGVEADVLVLVLLLLPLPLFMRVMNGGVSTPSAIVGQ